MKPITETFSCMEPFLIGILIGMMLAAKVLHGPYKHLERKNAELREKLGSAK